MIVKNVRFNECLLYEAAKYQQYSGISFSQIVRLALVDYLKKKMYDKCL